MTKNERIEKLMKEVAHGLFASGDEQGAEAAGTGVLRLVLHIVHGRAGAGDDAGGKVDREADAIGVGGRAGGNGDTVVCAQAEKLGVG